MTDVGDPKITLSEQWRFAGEGYFERGCGLHGDALHVETTSYLYVLDAVTGRLRWQVRADRWRALRLEATEDGPIYVTVSPGKLGAFDAETGRERWQFTTSEQHYAPGSLESMAGTLFACLGDGYLYAIDAESGRERWRFLVQTSHWPVRFIVAGDRVLATTGNGVLHAIDAMSGDERWRFEARKSRDTRLWTDGEVVFLEAGKFIHAIDAETGEQRRRYRLDAHGGPKLNAATPQEEFESSLFALSERAEVAQLRQVHRTGFLSKHPEVGLITIGDRDGCLYGYDYDTGEPRWRFAVGGVVSWCVTTMGDTVVAGTNRGSLFGIDATNGTERWRATFNGALRSRPDVCGDTLFICFTYIGGDGEVVSLRVREGSQS